MKKIIENNKCLYFLKELLKYKKEIGILSISTIVSTVTVFLQPLLIKQITDIGILEKNMPQIVNGVAGLFVCVLVYLMIEVVQAKTFAEIHNSFYKNLYCNVFRKLLHLKKHYFQMKNSMEIVQMLQCDVSQVASMTDRYVVMSFSYVFRVISGLAGLMLLSPELLCIVVIVIPVKYVLVKCLAKKREKNMKMYIQVEQQFGGWLGDTINTVEEIKLWNLYELRKCEFLKQICKSLAVEMKGTMIETWNIFGDAVLEWGVTILIYLVGGYLVFVGKISIGSVFAFVSYSSYVTRPVNSLIDLRMHFASVKPSAERLYTFLNMEEERSGSKRVEKEISPILEFKNVRFQYTKDREVLKKVSFKLEPGEKVAIIGKNGSGKSTILELLLRFYEPEEGEILCNGENIKVLKLSEYRSLFSVVSQKSALFLGDIVQNIDLEGKADRQKLNEVLRKSGVKKYLQRFPEKEKTQIGDDGAFLSGGERQRVSIARAILRNPKILILDEATAAMDTQTERMIQSALERLSYGRTTIIIAHRLSTLRNADKIIVIDGGKIPESGTHEELISQNGIYYKLYKYQLDALKNIGIEE